MITQTDWGTIYYCFFVLENASGPYTDQEIASNLAHFTQPLQTGLCHCAVTLDEHDCWVNKIYVGGGGGGHFTM